MRNIFELTETDKTVYEYQDLIKRIKELEKKVDEVIENYRNEEIKLHEIIGSFWNFDLNRKFSFFDKIIRRKEYLNYKNLSFEYENLLKQYDKEKATLEETKEKQIETLREEIDILTKRLKEIEDMALKSINNKFQTITRIFKNQVKYDENGIPIIDDTIPESFEKDFVNLNFDAETFSLDDIALVHTTNYFPENHTIKTAKDSNVLFEDDYALIEVNGEEKKGYSYSHRNTVHFALNGLVSSHTMGDFSNRKVIIIEPMKYHMDTIHCIRPEDTWTKGSVKLSDEAIILVREDEYDNLSREILSQYNVIKFTGHDEKVVEKILLLLGYKPQEIGKWNWVNNTRKHGMNHKILSDYIEKNYPEKLTVIHSMSIEIQVESILDLRDKIISAIRDEKVSTTDGLNISYKELIIMLEYGKRYWNKEEKDIIQYFGIRVKNNNFYLLDDDSIIESYKNELDLEAINEVQKAITFHKVFKPCLNERRESLSNIVGNLVDTKNNINLNLEMVFNMFYSYAKNRLFKEYSVRDFINIYGIRKYGNGYIMLNDLDMVKQYNNVDNNFIKEMEELIYNNKELSMRIMEEDEDFVY